MGRFRPENCCMKKVFLLLLTCLGLQAVAGCATQAVISDQTLVLTGGTVYIGENTEGVVADL